MNFGEALEKLKGGGFVNLEGWNGKNQYLGYQKPVDPHGMTRPYIYISPVDGLRVPWVASQTDMLADDWQWVNFSG